MTLLIFFLAYAITMNDPIKVLLIGENLDHAAPLSELLERQNIAEFMIIKVKLGWHGREDLIEGDIDCVLFESDDLGQQDEQAWLKQFEGRPRGCPAVLNITTELCINPTDDGNPFLVHLPREGLTADMLASQLKATLEAHKSNTQLLSERQALVGENEDLKHQLQELLTYSETVAHDLKNPIQSIGSLLKLLERRLWEFEGLTSHDRQLLAKCIDGSDRMQQLIADCLKRARGEAHALPHLHIDLNDIVAQVCLDLHEQIDARQAKVSHEPLPRCYANQSQMYQLFSNLIGNALKHSKPNTAPLIHISTSNDGLKDNPDGDKIYLELSFEDNGIGLKPEQLERACQPFERLDHDHCNGKGIGLSTVRKIISELKGTISVEASQQGGTCLNIKLPLHVRATAQNRVPRLGRQSTQEVFVDSPNISNSECVIVKNQSVGGYGCRYGGSHSFRKGDRVRLSQTGPEYEVRWTDLDEEGQLNFGLQELN